MELLGTSTIIGYILSTFSMKYVLVDDEDKSQKKIVFDLIYFISLVLFTIYTYLLMQDFYQKFNFIVSLEITFLIVNYLFFLFMFTKPIKHLGLVLLPLTLVTIPISMIYQNDSNLGSIDNDLKLHIIVSIASYGFLGLAAIQAILLRHQENKLKYINKSLFLYSVLINPSFK